MPPGTASDEILLKRDRLLTAVRAHGRCAVAYSGGVDSAVVAKAAQLVWGTEAIAVTAVSASLAAGELEQASRLAALIGIRHEQVATNELSHADYVRNAPDRCFYCKTELYSQLAAIAPRWGASVILNGANLDDQGDHRPGMRAAQEHQVASPLIEAGLNKADVRELAAHWELPVWDKPASPCLSSRVAYGEEVTPQRLSMIDRAEQWLRAQGLREVRVRYHRGDLARLEVPVEGIARLCEPALRGALLRELQSLGFKFVTLDLEGFRSGSLNTLIAVEDIKTISIR